MNLQELQREHQIIEGISSSSLMAFIVTSVTLIFSIYYINKSRLGRYIYRYIFQLNGNQENQEPAPPNLNDRTCCICLQEIVSCIQSNCGHNFCVQCIVQYWLARHKAQINCPLCRRKITFFFKHYQISQNSPADLINIDSDINQYNYIYSLQHRSLFQRIRDTPFLLQRLLTYMTTREGIFYIFKCIFTSYKLVLLIILILSPFDLIPEAIFGVIGLIDDVLMILLLLIIIANRYYNHVVRQQQQQL